MRFKILLLLIFSFSLSYCDIIPDDNKIEWTPGLPNGIPEITTNIVDVVESYSADKTGKTDSKKAIQDAINFVANSGGVVYIPEGEYLINGTLSIKNDGIVLRGAGANKTKLYFSDPTGACIDVVTYGRGDFQEFSGYDKDLKTVSVANGSKFTVGEFAEIQQENDEDFMYTDPEWNQSWAKDLVGQFFEVASVNGNEVTFKTPLHITYQSKFNPQIRPQRLIKNVGIEDLYLALTTDSDINSISFKNAAYCWVKNVSSYYSAKAHVASESTIGCEVRGSIFRKSHNYGGGGHGYGVSLGFHTTDWLIEDNAFDSLRHAMIFAKGANGNVFGYNYSINVLQGEGETNLNNGWIPPDVSNHGHYAYMNLIESNSVNEIGISDYWGPTGPGNLYFRNKVVNDETEDGISYYDHSTKQNVIGNKTIAIRDNDKNSYDNFEHGNVIDGKTVWNSDIESQELKSSYYLNSKPDFMTSWPLYGPEEGFDGKLPAQIRFEDGTSDKIADEKVVFDDDLSVYPNPFNPVTTVNFNTQSTKSSVFIYDLKGRVLFKKNFDKKGTHTFEFNGSKFASGIYFVQAKSVVRTLNKKIILLK